MKFYTKMPKALKPFYQDELTKAQFELSKKIYSNVGIITKERTF